ncbi:hypothetical protein OIE66_03390 [Nonomuraea sp. NBC_01738]|uniref:hypothetical protein n=1 Tax=Nonomuraea sp. NBC_01738 TaxID=2976003 RepID=UPI002E143174|nr:hypothetical protein OIE66_03390 [Nonomuraea sp. NBC_01738]
MSNFEERLFSALKDDLAGRAPTPLRSRRPLKLSAAVAGIAAAGTIGFLLYGGAATPAFAVERNPDGSVSVEINEFRDPADLEAKLADVGVQAKVDYLPLRQTCQRDRGALAGDDMGPIKLGVSKKGGSGLTFTLESGQIQADRTLVLVVSRDGTDLSKVPLGLSLNVVKGPVADCVPEPLVLPDKLTPSEDPGPSDTSRTESGDGPSTDVGGTN